MKEKLIDAIGKIDNSMIEDTDLLRQGTGSGKKFAWGRWMTAAACLCLVLCSTFLIFNHDHGDGIQKWNRNYSAEQYFANAAASESSSDAIVSESLPFAESRDFSDYRTQYEAQTVIPAIDTHPLFSAQVNYNEDGSVYDVIFSWYRRDEVYSDLTVTAGIDEVPQIQDCITSALDENGNLVEQGVTVTERDGVRIVTTGAERQGKTMTYQTVDGWYQITGSWNDSYEAVTALLDWFWMHPIDFSRFPMAEGAVYTDSNLTQLPNAFSAELPGFAELGFAMEESYVRLKNGEPVSMEAYYASDTTKIHWCINAQPSVYDYADCIGTLEALTEEQVLGLKPADDVTTQTKVTFVQDDCVVVIYATDLHQVWTLIESIQ